MDILAHVIIAGLATAFTLATIDDLLSTLIPTKVVKLVLTIPLSALFVSAVGTYSLVQLAVLGTAAGFFSLSTLLLVNRPVSIQTSGRRR
jgi:hypothetical protein